MAAHFPQDPTRFTPKDLNAKVLKPEGRASLVDLEQPGPGVPAGHRRCARGGSQVEHRADEQMGSQPAAVAP